MRLSITILLLSFCIIASSQTFEKPIKRENKPVSVIRHKFNSKEGSSQVDMIVPDHRTCLTPEMHTELQTKYGLPSIEEYEIEFNKLKKDYLVRRKSTNATSIIIPVIVHVIHNGESIGTGANISAAQVKSQIEVLNEDFRRKEGTNGFNSHSDGADVEIEFVLALRDASGNELQEAGIHRVNGTINSWDNDRIEDVLKPQTIWNPKKYMNVWTVNFGGDLEDILGYAQFPSLSGLGGLDNNGGLAATDGVVIGYRYFGRVGDVAEHYDGGRTATHEVGHWLGLRHIWGDGDCSEDDFCEDTPNAGHSNYTCEPINSCGLFVNDMIENYMDYTPDACMNIFTEDQKARMQVVMEVSPRRKQLLNSDVHLTLDRPIAFFSSNKTEVCSGETIEFADNSINNPTSWEWTFFNSSMVEVAVFSDKDPALVFSGIGVYGLQLIVSNSSGSDTIFEPNYISVLSSEILPPPFEEDFENQGVLENWVFYNPDGDRTWQETNSANSSSGSWSIFIDNYSSNDGDPTGNFDAFFSPKLDLSSFQDVYLIFDIAYAKYGGNYSDTLAIYASSDCGGNFDPIWYKGGFDLATAASTQENYIPSSEDWITERVSLKELNGIADVHLAFVNWSGWGNNLYIDNIKIVIPSYSTPSESFFYTPFDTISIGSTISFADYSNYFPTNWSWVFESGSPSTSNLQNPYVTYNSIGSFDVEFATSNSSGGDSWNRTNHITVVDNPTISSFANRANNTICSGDSITITAEGGYYYEWYDERGYFVSNEKSLTVYPQISTSFRVVGYNIYGGSSSSIEVVIVNPQPVFSLGEDKTIASDDSLLLDVGMDYPFFLWSDNTTDKTLLIKGSDLGIGSHDIWVIVTDNNGCQSVDTLSIIVEQGVGIIELPEMASSIKVYPIPAKDFVYVELNNFHSPINCEIINSTGQCLKSFEFQKDTEIIDFIDFYSGYYNIRFHNENFDKSILIIVTD